jgi:hypothetical protein
MQINFFYQNFAKIQPPCALFSGPLKSHSRETKCQAEKIPRKYVTDGKEKFLGCQFMLHLAANYL